MVKDICVNQCFFYIMVASGIYSVSFFISCYQCLVKLQDNVFHFFANMYLILVLINDIRDLTLAKNLRFQQKN